MTTERRNRIDLVLAKRQNDITLVLENVFDPHNISAILRNCDAVGIPEIYVLNTKLPRHEGWGFKSSRSAVKWVAAHQFTNVQECMKAVRTKYVRILTTYLTEEALSLYAVDLTQRTALVFGNEQNGISDEMKEWSDGNFTIPQVGMLRSLNISVACAVTLYEAYRQKNGAGHYAEPKLSNTEQKILRNQWGQYDENNL